MRVEITLPDDKQFKDKLQRLADAENRSRKNWLETIIINEVLKFNTQHTENIKPKTN